MNFNIQYENPDESLLTRLFKVRGIQDDPENFLKFCTVQHETSIEQATMHIGPGSTKKSIPLLYMCVKN